MQQRALAALNQYNVATAPTACGIETLPPLVLLHHFLNGKLQQHLPLAVLKPDAVVKFHDIGCVATAPTACGIETREIMPITWYGITNLVATAPTACGIETPYFFLSSANNS